MYAPVDIRRGAHVIWQKSTPRSLRDDVGKFITIVGCSDEILFIYRLLDGIHDVSELVALSEVLKLFPAILVCVVHHGMYVSSWYMYVCLCYILLHP